MRARPAHVGLVVARPVLLHWTSRALDPFKKKKFKKNYERERAVSCSLNIVETQKPNSLPLNIEDLVVTQIMYQNIFTNL
jgi:hypothetical protein